MLVAKEGNGNGGLARMQTPISQRAKTRYSSMQRSLDCFVNLRVNLFVYASDKKEKQNRCHSVWNLTKENAEALKYILLFLQPSPSFVVNILRLNERFSRKEADAHCNEAAGKNKKRSSGHSTASSTCE